MNFDRLTEYLDHLPRNIVPGCDLVVWAEHRPVYRHFAGERAPGQPMTGHETYWLYSATKVMTMTLTMQMVERGALRLSDRVADYLPAFGRLTVQDGETVRPARTELTLEHLMAMQGGLDYDRDTPAIRRTIEAHGDGVTTVQLSESFAEKPLHFDPGMGYLYSLCHDVVGAVLEVVAGKPLGALAREQLFEPLGIQNMSFHPNAAQRDRMAMEYSLTEDGRLIPAVNRPNPFSVFPHYDSGGGGLMGDVDSYILLADALANDGVGANGVRILTRASIDDMRTNRQHGTSMDDFRRLLHKHGYGYGLGVRTLIDPTTSKSTVGEFGWDGAAGAWTLMDVDRHIAAFYAQHVLGCNQAFYEYHPRIRDLIYEGMDA